MWLHKIHDHIITCFIVRSILWSLQAGATYQYLWKEHHMFEFPAGLSRTHDHPGACLAPSDSIRGMCQGEHRVWYTKGIAAVINWVSNLIVSEPFLTLIEALGSAGTYLLFAGFSATGLAAIYFLVPNKKGLQIEVEKMLEKGFKPGLCCSSKKKTPNKFIQTKWNVYTSWPSVALGPK